MKLTYIVEDLEAGNSINHILTTKLNISARLLSKLIKSKKIFVNEGFCNTRNIVNSGDRITLDFNLPEKNNNIVATPMPLDIIYEDAWFLVINKPANMPIHPSRLHYADSLSNGVKAYFDSISLPKKIRPVNRLDLDTSGLVIFAKCEYIQECFIQQMKENTFKKEYLCLVEGRLKNKIGTISLPIARKNGSIIERCIDEKHGKPSLTDYEVLQELESFSLVKCQLQTGRTHQIRVHMAALGNPLLRRYFVWSCFFFP